MIKVCLAGATGWAGSELARSIANTPDVALVAAVSRKHAGRGLGEVLGEPRLTCPVYRSAKEALVNPCDVFIEYTKPDTAKASILAALERGIHVVVWVLRGSPRTISWRSMSSRAGNIVGSWPAATSR